MTADDLEMSEGNPPQWQGINHLALITADMDATVRFYHGTLGARLVATIGTDTFRHYFFDFGPNCTVAFFEYIGSPAQPFAKPAGVPDSRAPQFDHLSLNLPDEESLNRLQRRLKAADCEVTDIVDHGFIRSVYFSDPNGIALEASWWVHNPTTQAADYADRSMFADHDPVAAVKEIEATDTLTSTPSTRLI
jgi:catechol 2,3-dioxygenase-like lactoylglutathione lyase family enzyme